MGTGKEMENKGKNINDIFCPLGPTYPSGLLDPFLRFAGGSRDGFGWRRSALNSTYGNVGHKESMVSRAC